ncbi:hypothetical protein [uncultured Shimia sp.]|uniref:hypothetical protein n=1 Tax=uncultured Shimia sp. TaxID=573152 RepID=UPI00260853DA|nr:hypothetical protein [uncultured Shimia sp.]
MKKTLVTILSLLVVGAAHAGCPGYTDEELLMENYGDDRHVRSASSPQWLEAVGKFVHVKNPQWQLDQGDEKEFEICSVSLVSDTVGGDGQIIVGAGHCVVQWVSGFNRKESSYIDALRATTSGKHWESDTVYDWDFREENTAVIFTSQTGEVVKRRLEEIFFAETDRGDYFIGKLDDPISYRQIKPLLNAPADYSDLLDQDEFPGAFATMAGFSRDSGRGQNGKVMTYDVCNLAGGQNGLKMGHCYTYGGASGGATAVTVDLRNANRENAEFWVEYFEETLNGRFEQKEYTFWVGNIVGSRCSQAKENRTFFTESTHHTRLLDAILLDHR